MFYLFITMYYNYNKHIFGEIMKKYTFYILTALVLLLSASCINEIGDPPDLVLNFNIDSCFYESGTLRIEYTITNEGDEDLENCKIEIAVASAYTYWTDGFNLDEGESNTETENTSITTAGYDINDLKVISAGFDSSKSNGVIDTTIIKFPAE